MRSKPTSGDGQTLPRRPLPAGVRRRGARESISSSPTSLASASSNSKARSTPPSTGRCRPDLVRTLKVLPPVVDGRVRIVTIAGFDTQACGGTHVHSTGEIGRVRIVKFHNKGKDNKRFYWAIGTRGSGGGARGAASGGVDETRSRRVSADPARRKEPSRDGTRGHRPRGRATPPEAA
ncbi:MAG: hypothetical protein HYU25_15500 [Candidatus Rokubacteria bacterium]|nr:hypothetical protein [Candidatus Rokubacteria bacterium]